MTKLTIKILWFLLGTILACAIGLGLYQVQLTVRAQSRQPITASAESATVNDGILCRGVIVYDEELLYKDTDRVYSNTAMTGKRLSAKSTVAVSFSDPKLLEIHRRAELLKARIAMYQSLTATEDLAASLPGINTAIAEALRTSARFSDNGLFSALPGSEFANAETLLLRREQALNTAVDYSGKITELRGELDTLQAKLLADRREVITEKAGYFSVFADGYELLLTPDNIMEMTVKELDNLIALSSEVAPSENVLGKMVYGYSWHLLLSLSPNDAWQVSVGKTYRIQVNQEQVSAYVEALNSDENGNVLAVMRCDAALADMGAERIQKCLLILDTYTGFKVPTEAMRVLDGETCVYVLEGIKVVQKPVKILYSCDGYYIVEAEYADRNKLFLYDRLILGREDLYDGKVLQ